MEHMETDDENQQRGADEEFPEYRQGQPKSETVLAVVWGAGKLGGAYYDLQSSELFLFPDAHEAAPDFEILRALFKQVNPKILIGCARQDPRAVALLKELSGDPLAEGTNEPSQSTGSTTTPSTLRDNGGTSLFIQPGKEFAPDSCKRRLQDIRLPEEPRNGTEREHLYFITSLIPFANIGMVRAAGALLKFLDKRGLEVVQLEVITGKAPVLNVKIFTMTDLVYVDYTAWDSLQIFNPDTVTFGKKNTYISPENPATISLYGVMNRCLTTQGSNTLRLQLLRPTRNVELLNRRQDVIQHCVPISQTAFVRSVTEHLKGMGNLPKLLQRFSLYNPTVQDWKQLYRTLYNCILIGEACSSQTVTIQLFQDITNLCKNDAALSSVTKEILRVMDFEQSTILARFYPQSGLNEHLDEKREQYNTLQAVMSSFATAEFDLLPDFVDQCSIIYLPEVGYLLSVSLWREDLTQEELVFEGLEYKFTCSDSAYYSTPRTKELDAALGDTQVVICELENYIKVSLIQNILRYSTTILNISAFVSELDSLLALASVAREHNYVRPRIVSSTEKLQIVNGKHPLVELNSDFVPNSTLFEDGETIVILTGPNASGKSIYLKQVGIMVIMALAGSFVPATSAVIPTFDRLCTRIHAQESVSVGLSTFMIDINQMSLALRNVTGSSLVIIDEFGKGTAEADGLSLLVASLEEFGNRGPASPTVFVSTHYNSLMNWLPRLNIFKPLTMDFLMENDKIVYLFKLKDGVCQSSFACEAAAEIGIPPDVIARAHEAEAAARRDFSHHDLESDKFQHEKESVMIQVAENFQTVNFTEVNPQEYLHTVFAVLHPFMTTDDPVRALTNQDIPVICGIQPGNDSPSTVSSSGVGLSVSQRDDQLVPPSPVSPHPPNPHELDEEVFPLNFQNNTPF